MASNSPDQRAAKVDELVARIVRKQEAGQRVDLDRIFARYPDLAESIRAFLDDADYMDRVRGGVSEASIDTDASGAGDTNVYRRDGAPNRSAEPTPSDEPPPGTTYVMGLPPEFASGERAFDRYRIENQLGEGAMGSVYLAHDTTLDRKVALKTPKFDAADAARLSKRFRREARAAAKLHHRNICPVYDVGRVDGIDFLTMAYIEGKPLSAFISLDKPLAQRQVALVIRKLALALQAAHDAGVIHRDLKPSNVLIDSHGEPVVMDFGLAGGVEDSSDSRLTKTGMVLGTPAYMSPEQIEGNQKLVGPRSDVYSLGVMMYELLAGRLPFRGSPAAVMGKVLMAKPPSLQSLRPDIDPALESICASMMVKSPAQRCPSMKQVASELTRWIRESRHSEMSPRIDPSTSTPASTPAADGVPSIVTTGEEIAAIADRAASGWRGEVPDVSEARQTQRVRKAGRLFKLNAWFGSLPVHYRFLVLVGALLPLIVGASIFMLAIEGEPAKSSAQTSAPPDATSEQVESQAGPSLAEIEPSDSGWINLIDGGLSRWRITQPDSETWKPIRSLWSVDGDTLRAKRDGHHWIETVETFKDFELRCEYRMPNEMAVGANGSGVVVRAVEQNSIGLDPKGIEIDLRASHDEKAGVGTGCFIAYETPITNHRALYNSSGSTMMYRHLGWLKPPKLNARDWNHLEIRCEGEEITVTVNGEVVNRGWQLPERKGSICLRSQNTQVEFRDLQVRRLSENRPPPNHLAEEFFDFPRPIRSTAAP
jgi:tRNA A-37 threonylcarbamoyl transferase component Bud32